MQKSHAKARPLLRAFLLQAPSLIRYWSPLPLWNKRNDGILLLQRLMHLYTVQIDSIGTFLYGLIRFGKNIGLLAVRPDLLPVFSMSCDMF